MNFRGKEHNADSLSNRLYALFPGLCRDQFVSAKHEGDVFLIESWRERCCIFGAGKFDRYNESQINQHSDWRKPGVTIRLWGFTIMSPRQSRTGPIRTRLGLHT